MKNPSPGDVVCCYTTFRARPYPNTHMPEFPGVIELFAANDALVVMSVVPTTDPWRVISDDRTHDVQVLLPNGRFGYIFSDYLDLWEEDETGA